MREEGSGGQDMWAELQKAADSVKELPFSFLVARENSSALGSHLLPREGGI